MKDESLRWDCFNLKSFIKYNMNVNIYQSARKFKFEQNLIWGKKDENLT